MSKSETYGRKVIGRRGALALAALVSAVVVYSAAVAPPASANTNFCSEVSLAPYGQSGDRCYGPGNLLYSTDVQTYERAGCVDVANSSNELLQSWSCAGMNTFAYVYLGNDGVRRKGVIRNNNLSFSGKFSGGEACYSGC